MTSTLNLERRRNRPRKPKPSMITLRLSDELHDRLLAAARVERVSLNGLLLALVEQWLSGRPQPPTEEAPQATDGEPGASDEQPGTGSQPPTPEERAAKFTRRFPKGTKVWYWPVLPARDIPAKETTIVSDAFASCSGEVVVFVADVRGYVACSHITPR